MYDDKKGIVIDNQIDTDAETYYWIKDSEKDI